MNCSKFTKIWKKKVEKQKERKILEKVNKNQNIERWNNNEIEQLLIYLEENYK